MRRTTPWGGRCTLSLSALLAVAIVAFSAHAEDKTLNRLDRLDVNEGEKATQIVVRGSTAPTFTVFKLKDPVRLFIDVSNADITGVEGPFDVENGVVSQVTTLQFNDDLVRIGRIIVGLDVDALYSVRAEGNDLVVKIDGSQRKAQRQVVVTKTVVDEAALASARERVVQAQTRAAAAETRAREADARAHAASQTAQASTAAAEARAAQAESRARKAEAMAQQEAAEATATARNAGLRASAAEARAMSAERDAEAARTAASRSGAESQSSAAAKVKVAESRAAEATKIANAARASADASQRALRAKSTEVEARMAEAQARAAESEARARKAEDEAVAKAKEASVHARAARAAEARARDANTAAAEADAQTKAAESRAARAETLAQQAEARANTAESRASTAENRASTAESRANTAETRASTAEAKAISASDRAATAEAQASSALDRAATAEAKATTARDRAALAEAAAKNAQGETAAAEARTLQAEERAKSAATKASSLAKSAREASRRADLAEASAAQLRATLKSADKNAAAGTLASLKAAEAEARARAAEARAKSAEAEQARLAEKTAAIEAAQQEAIRDVERMRAEQGRLTALLAASKSENNAVKTQRLQAEQRAQNAKMTAERARVTQLESARAASNLDQRVAELQAKLEDAKRNDRSAEATLLDQKLVAAKGEATALRSALQSRDADLEAARQAAEISRQEAEGLKAALAVKAQEVKAAEARAQAAAQQPQRPAVASRAPLRVERVQFADTGDRTEIQIRVKGKPDYTVRREGDRTRILEFKNALVDPAIERSLDTSEFGSVVQLVSTFQAPPPGDRVRVVVTLAKGVKDAVELSNGRLVWAFPKSKTPPPAVVVTPPPPVRVVVPPAPTWQAPPPPAGTFAPTVPIAQPRAAVFTGLGQSISTNNDSRPRPARRRRFTGRKINIDIKDGDIHNILRLLAKEGNVNIVTSDEVDGTVTMHLKLVPWDQALDIILRTKGLDMVREGDIIRIATAEAIAKERDNELKKIEVKEKLKPLEVKLISVNHADAKDLMPRVKSVLSKRGKSEFDERTNTVILKDVDDHLDAAEDLIRRLDTQTPQVLIETRIVEVNEVNVQELGIQWGFDSTSSAGTGNPTGLRFPSSIGISGGSDDQQTVTEGVSSNPNFVVNLPAAAGNGAGGSIGLTFGSIDSTFNLNVRLSALENIGSVKIISSPKITTLDNKRARISQGVSIPISQISASGVQTVFFDAVLALQVMPHVTQDGNIYLEIKAENNTPDFQNVGARGDPTILKKEAETQLLLKDGDTTVIGGIYTSNAGYNRAEVPYLARIPILGAFFRNHRESDRRTELLIFVTPRIVNRAASTVRTAP